MSATFRAVVGRTGEPSGTRSFLSEAAETVLVNVVLATGGLVTGIWSARLLGPDGRGQLAAIQGWPLLLSSAALLGMPEGIIYFGARRPLKLGTLSATSLYASLASGAGFALIGWAIMPLVLRAQTSEVVLCAQWFLLYIGIYALTAVPIYAFRALGRIRAWNVIRLCGPLPWFAALTIAAVLQQRQASVVAAYLLVGTAIISVAIAFLTFKKIPGAFRFDRRELARLLPFGSTVFLSTLPQFVNLRLDQLLMAGLLPARSLGLYVVAVSWAAALTPLSTAIASVLFPRVAAMTGAGVQQAFVFKALIGCVAVSLCAAAIWAVVTPYAMPAILGRAFEPAVGAAWILILANVVAGANAIMEEGLKGMGRPRSVLTAEIIGAVVTVALLSLLLRRYEAVGAAVASLGAYATTAVVLSAQVMRRREQEPSMVAE